MNERVTGAPRKGLNPRGGNFVILRPHEFLGDFSRRARTATKRVWLQTMYYYADSLFGQFADVLTDAAGRNVDSRFHVDYFTKMVSSGKLNFIPSPNPAEAVRKKRRRKAASKALEETKKQDERSKKSVTS